MSVKNKIILGIESSCDETGAALGYLKGSRVSILSSVVASSANLQAKYGGVIPEQAAREQMKVIIPTIEESLQKANLGPQDIESIAVTIGPGLIGSLLIGVETAKVLSLIWQKPLIPINHLIAHFYANWIETESTNDAPIFPFIGLLVSGGHSDILLFENHLEFTYLGGTRDDAAGEAFDKSARLLGLPYPGGPQIAQLAQSGNSKAFRLPRPLSDSEDFDFSFSGLKTAVSNLVSKTDINDQNIHDLCASIQQAIIDSLIKKVTSAAKLKGIGQIVLAGGVASNKTLVEQLRDKFDGAVISPPPYLCTDNAAMTVANACFSKPSGNIRSIQANPNLSLAN